MESKYQEALNYLVNNCYEHDSWNDDFWHLTDDNESIANLQELIDNYVKLEKAFDDACKLLDTIEYSRYKEGQVKEQVYENHKPWKEKLLAFYDKKVHGND